MTMKRPQRGRINKDGALIEEGLPGWAIEKLFALQKKLETAMPWDKDSLIAQINQIKTADYNDKR